jgi:hypothetical protein
MSEAVASFTKEHTLSERSLREKNRERKKRVVVTGGSGRLGRCVVREMVEHGWEVYNRMYPHICLGVVTDMYSGSGPPRRFRG